MEIKAGNNVLTIDMQGDTKEEDQMFLEVAKHVIDKKLGVSSTEEISKPVEEVKKEVFEEGQIDEPKEVAQPIAEPKIIKAPVVPINPQLVSRAEEVVPARKFETTRDFLEAQDRRLVIGVCDCEKDYHFWIYDKEQKELKFTCKRCQEEKIIDLEEVIPANYRCPECGKRASFWMEPAQATAIDCAKCGAEIDMYYHDKKKIMSNED